MGGAPVWWIQWLKGSSGVGGVESLGVLRLAALAQDDGKSKCKGRSRFPSGMTSKSNDKGNRRSFDSLRSLRMTPSRQS